MKLEIIRQNNGSALIAVLVVLFVLLSIFFAILGLAISRAGIVQKEIYKTQASYLADAGLNRFLYAIDRDSLNWQEAINLKISESIAEKEEFNVDASLAGGYILATSTGKSGKYLVSKRALIGLMPNHDLNSAIINPAVDYPLTLAGRTNITGDVIVGSGSVTRGSIEGEAYQNEELVNGRIITRAIVQNPEVDNKAIKDYLDDLTNKAAFPDKYIIGSSVLTEFDNPDLDKPFTIKVEENLEINNLKLNAINGKISIIAGGNINIKGQSEINGLIEFISGKSIYIEEGSHLDGPTLFGEDSVVFSGKSVFSGQVLTSSKIIIKDGVFINNPSLLYVINQDENEPRLIEFGPKTYSRTVAILEGENERQTYESQKILIDTNSYVSGFVFSEAYSDIRGTLYGISETKSYFYYREPTFYINWLRNATIDRSRLDFIPVLPVTFPNNYGYAVFRIYEES